ncbi:FecR family protein [Ulvibacterium marinum]|uniref:FecR family protein n=1 Tax=Ulvibacterium marinum TaxID=2419782 RepID=UPI002494AD7E|nr:FecR domain-containing protein [Ulvibacterium marinum]
MKNLIIKFLTDTISYQELTTLYNWLQDPENQEYFKAMVRANEKLDLVHRPIDVEIAYKKVLNNTSKTRRSLPKRYRYPIFKYAAVAVTLISTSVGLYHLIEKDEVGITDSAAETTPQITLELEDGSLLVLDEKEQTTLTNKRGDQVVSQEYDKLKYKNDGTAEGKLVYNQLTVPYGKRFTIELADGTVVFLNAGTKLRYPKVFTDPKSREVYLDGEAFFEVAENAAHPFIVHTEKMNVRVLGTQFNVSSYKNENNTSTVLVKGSVGVYRPSEAFDTEKSIVISPRQQASIQEEEFTVREVNVQKHIAWTKGQLYFVNDRFGNIVKEMERHYDIKIENNYPELNDTRYTGTFESETIEQVLNVFKRNTQFEYRIEKDKIIITTSP